MKKVLWLSSWYPNRYGGRNGNFVERQARIVASFSDLWVMQVQYAGKKYPPGIAVERYAEKGFTELILYYFCAEHFLSKLFFRAIAYLRGLYLAYRLQGKPDIIHAHVMLDAGIIGWLYSRIWSVPFFVSEHATLFQRENLPLYRRWWCRRVIAAATLVVAVSHQLRDRLERLSPGCLAVLGNPVDTRLFCLPAKPRTGPKLRLLHISTLKQETKNIAGLLRVIAALRDQSERLSFTIAGDGPLDPWLDFADRLQLPEGYLHISGDMSETDVAACMQSHDVFVLFSFVENLPCVLLEAQACGMPILATRAGGVPEIVVDDRFGWLVAPGDEAGLRAAILRMLEAYSSFDGNLIRAHALKHYTISGFAQQIQEWYARG